MIITAVAARVAIDEEGRIFFDGARVDNAKDVEWGVRAILANKRKTGVTVHYYPPREGKVVALAREEEYRAAVEAAESELQHVAQERTSAQAIHDQAR